MAQPNGDEEYKDIPRDFYWIRHAQSCANISESMSDKMRSPVLTRLGMEQSIILGYKYMNSTFGSMEGEKLAITCSPLVRTIMTCLLSMRTFTITHPQLTIKLNTKLSEHHNVSHARIPLVGTTIVNLDSQNKIQDPRNLKICVKFIKNWLVSRWLIDYNDPEFEDLVQQFDNMIIDLQNNFIDLKLYDDNKIIIDTCRKHLKTIRELLSALNNNTPTLMKQEIVLFLDYVNRNILSITDERFILINNLFIPLYLAMKKFTREEFFRGLPVFFNDRDEFTKDKIYSPFNYDKKVYDDNVNISGNLTNFIKEMNQNYKDDPNRNIMIQFTHGSLIRDHSSLDKGKVVNTMVAYSKNNIEKSKPMILKETYPVILYPTKNIKREFKGLFATCAIDTEEDELCNNEEELNKVQEKLLSYNFPTSNSIIKTASTAASTAANSVYESMTSWFSPNPTPQLEKSKSQHLFTPMDSKLGAILGDLNTKIGIELANMKYNGDVHLNIIKQKYLKYKTKYLLLQRNYFK